MDWFASSSRGIYDKVTTGDVVSNFLAFMEAEFHNLLHKIP